jgi:hypothetical protein
MPQRLRCTNSPAGSKVLTHHCSEYLHKVAKAQYGQTGQALEWVEATLTRLYMSQVGTVLGGLRRMQPYRKKR